MKVLLRFPDLTTYALQILPPLDIVMNLWTDYEMEFFAY